MSGHTPGPWFHGDSMWGCVTTRAGGFGDVVATVPNAIPDSECRANARLMAAAPDLLDAMKAIRPLLSRIGGDYCNGAPDCPCCLAQREVDHAIAKAEGKP